MKGNKLFGLFENFKKISKFKNEEDVPLKDILLYFSKKIPLNQDKTIYALFCRGIKDTFDELVQELSELRESGELEDFDLGDFGELEDFGELDETIGGKKHTIKKKRTKRKKHTPKKKRTIKKKHTKTKL